MRRRGLLLLAIGGCGSVQDAPDASVDLGSLRPGCVLMLHMDEESWGGPGSVRDDCGDHHGTPSGGITTVPDGVRGRAGRFQSDGCIEIGDAPDLRAGAALTMSAWVRPTSLNNSDAYGVISKRVDMADRSAYNLYLWINDHAWVDIESNDDRFETTTPLANDRWTQLTVVFDGARAPDQRVRVYTDGTFDVAARETASAIMPYTSPLRVGCFPTPGNQLMQYFAGLIDEVAIWTRALTDPEIVQWHDATKPR